MSSVIADHPPQFIHSGTVGANGLDDWRHPRAHGAKHEHLLEIPNSFWDPRPIGFDDIANFYSQMRKEHIQNMAHDPERATVHADLERLVRTAIEDLPPEFRLAVLLADIEGCSYKEIAEMMECPIGTVMSRLYRGRQLLQATLKTLVER